MSNAFDYIDLKKIILLPEVAFQLLKPPNFYISQFNVKKITKIYAGYHNSVFTSEGIVRGRDPGEPMVYQRRTERRTSGSRNQLSSRPPTMQPVTTSPAVNNTTDTRWFFIIWLLDDYFRLRNEKYRATGRNWFDSIVFCIKIFSP